MSVKAIRLRNFRGFDDARIELKPLTVLLGPNSSGKSAFGHALAAMAHAQWFHSGSGQASLTPAQKDAADWPIDLGNLSDLRTVGIAERVYIELETDEGQVEFGFGFEPPVPDVNDLRLSYLLHPRGLDEISRGKPGALHGEAREGAESQVVHVGTRESKPSLILRRVDQNEWVDESEDLRASVTVGLDGLIAQTVTHLPGGTPRQLSGPASKQVRDLLRNLTYLRATRRRPSRSYNADKGLRQALGYAGEWTATVLNERAEKDVAFVSPPEVPGSLEDAVARLDCRWNSNSTTLSRAVDEWLRLLDLAQDAKTSPSPGSRGKLEIRVTVAGRHNHNLIETGFGISQVLPVLVGGLLQEPDSLMIVDLPEAHLHPRPQAALADFFCSLAMSGRTALVETHSEMFFHRLRLRAEMNKDLADRIAVYFIDPPKADGMCSNPREVGLGFDDELRWPARFLQEAWEVEAQISAAREARRLAKK